VVRGGCWDDSDAAGRLRSAYRDIWNPGNSGGGPSYRLSSVGFRLVRPGNDGSGPVGNPLTGDVTITAQGGNTVIPTTLTASYNGGETVTYQWKRGDATISGATGTTYQPAQDGTYTVTVSAGGYSKTSNAIAITGGGDATPYIITGSGTAFTVVKGSATIGSANRTIQSVITSIRKDAKGNACTVQFGNGTATLDIGSTADITFENDMFDKEDVWGAVTLKGKITSAYSSTMGMISIYGVAVTSYADIENTTTSTFSVTVSIYKSGSLTISGGTVSAKGKNGYAVNNNSTGPVTISGGTVLATGDYSYAVYNSSTGPVTISSGTVSATGSESTAVYNGNSSGTAGTVTISGGTVSATGSNSTAVGNNGGVLTISNGEISAAGSKGTAVNNQSNGSVTISGGTVSATGPDGNAVYNRNGKVTIKNGDVSATGDDGRAVYNYSGEVTISGGNVSATGDDGRAVYNSSGEVTISGGTILATEEYAYAVYNSGSLTISSGTVSATGSNGYAVYNGYSATVSIVSPPAVIIGTKYGCP
jgi:lipopolysaccharide export system protein LptA